MSTTQILCSPENWQLEPSKNLVEDIPVEERKKLSENQKLLESIQDCNWEDLRGLSFVFEENWI